MRIFSTPTGAPAIALLLTMAAAGDAVAQPAKPPTLPSLPQCIIEQGVPEKGMVGLGPPDPRSAFTLTSNAAAGRLDYGAYRWTLSGLRVRLCEASLLLGKQDWASAKARLDDGKPYSDAVVLADQAFQVRAETQSGLCLDYAKQASIKIGEIEGQSAKLKDAIQDLTAKLKGFETQRQQWQQRVDATRQQIQTAIDDHNDRENSFWHQVGSFFGASSDDGIDQQLNTLNGILQDERAKLQVASINSGMTEGEALQKYNELKTALAQITQVQAQLGALKKAINALDDAKFGMTMLRSAFDAFIKEMNADLPNDEFRGQLVRKKIEALRDAIFDFGEAFPSGVLASCNPVAITADTKQVPW